eukprot:CAMPEP_0197021072 /NCGR_PEP_ID=MMETSP1384-20130603/1958_1 /TAXON_ID=29189 /ORGANISM="Ammonia sp." /LENGTH=489 /DNA_ID=CAMNT_0042448823 /DNA_START=28 /DNA_END=1497 /DNA_ORIENTATION=+
MSVFAWWILVTSSVCCVYGQQSKSSDDFATTFSSELGPMDYIWITYAVLAVLGSLCFITPFGIWKKWCQAANYDGCSEPVYAQIIDARGYDANAKGLGDKRALSLMVLRADLKEKLIWHNDWKKDFAVFIRNEHALFSTCYAHPDHPFSRKNRRIILASTLMLDFGFAMGVTYAFAFINFGETSSFILDYLISYFFGIMMTTIESILVKFAVCAAAEKCPTCIRTCCTCCSDLILVLSLFWGFVGFSISISFMLATALQGGEGPFWSVFALNFIVGLIQAWFLIDLIKMGLQFRTGWKEAHPPPPGPEREEDKKQKASFCYKCGKLSFCVCCFPIWLLWQCCCTKRKKADPYDDGQDDFGVNYHEYVNLKTGEEIGERKLPHSYQTMSGAEFKRKMDKALDGKVDAVQQSYQKKMDSIKKTEQKVNQSAKDAENKMRSAQDAVTQKTKMFGGKLKSKAMGMSIKLGKKKKDEQQAGDDEVELVVDQQTK